MRAELARHRVSELSESAMFRGCIRLSMRDCCECVGSLRTGC